MKANRLLAASLIVLTVVVTGCVEEVPLDVKPRSCPNQLNLASASPLTVAMLGTTDFDVSKVKTATIVLAVVAGDVDPANATEPTVFVAPIAGRTVLEDVTAPAAKAGECTEAGPDGHTDLVMHFDVADIVGAIAADVGPVEDGDEVLVVTGAQLQDDSYVYGVDWIVIRK